MRSQSQFHACSPALWKERGIAHIIEHLGFLSLAHKASDAKEASCVIGHGMLIVGLLWSRRFSATKAYENHAIVKFLESIGAPFGACQRPF